jgi:perosamine synthetase
MGSAGVMISIADPQIGDIEEKLALEVLRSGRLSQGMMVERFEEAVRDVVNAEHAVAVNNGTSALIAALIAAGIGPGDEVITTPFTFIATLNAILFVGATPRYADVGDDFTIDSAEIERLINDRTRAILPVHLYGLLADMDAIADLAARHHLVIIEDAAQAFRARMLLLLRNQERNHG